MEAYRGERLNPTGWIMVAVGLGLIVLLLPHVVMAAAPFGQGATTLKNDLVTLLTPVVAIAVLGVAVACAFNRISWWWFGGIVIGIVIFFGNEQIVSWIRGSFGV